MSWRMMVIFLLKMMKSKYFICLTCLSILSYLALDHFANGEIPIMLWWTDQIFPHFLDGHDFALIKCGNVRCHSTNKREYLENPLTRGVFFYGTGVDLHDLPLPRNTNHEWCLFHEESPLNNYVLSHQNFIQLFNHTATFRRESDYPITTQDIYSLEYLIDRQPIDINVKNKKRKEDKYAPLLYVQSHENVPSFRNMYVEELMKYIDVDSYGTNLHNKDLPENLREAAESFQKDQFLDFIADYKFHLSFENGVCDDYMTEKLMRPLHLGSIPVYYGSPKARDWMPDNNSIIMVNDFKSPEALAKFIKYLDENDEEYLKYLKFKKPGGITNQFLKDTVLNRDWGSQDHKYYFYNIEDKYDYYQGFECYVCKEIHKINSANQLERSPKMANNSHLGCPKPFSPLQDKPLPPNQWTSIYEQSKLDADAVVRMLHAGETDSSKMYIYRSMVENSHNTGEL